MRLGQTSVIYFISKVGGSAFGFVATIYFARVLGEEVLGFYALVLALVTWLTLVGSIGWTGAVTKRVSEGNEREAYATAGAIIIAALGVSVGIGVFLFREQVNVYVGRPVAGFVALIVLTVLFRSLLFSTLKGYHLVHIYAPLSTIKLGVRSVAQIALVFLGFGLTGLLVGYIAGGIFAIVVSVIVLRFRPAIPDREHFSSLFDYAKFSWLGSIRGRTFDQVDIVVLGFFVSAGLVGIYSVAWTLSKFLDIFGSAVSNTLFPEMSEIAAKNEPESVSGLVEDGLAFGGLIIIPGLVGGTLLADRLMAIYGEGFVDGQVVLPILIASLLVYTYNKQLLNTLNAIDRPDLAFRANAVFIVSNLVLNVALVYTIGWVGAAIATASSAAIGLVFGFYYTRRHVGFSVPLEEISKQCVAALLMGVVVYAARVIGEPHPIAAYNEIFVVALVGLGALVYFLVLLTISSAFRTTVSRNLPFDVPLARN
ncbi:polysaccharide biosynthesis C-terminal domain-containing protein [Natronobeatus ordinarius]|uniref:oligosaccharide flippase family protein n=1 Tax=Natronobeatus ordinarius TaxID=2963433 RepID=UPI0020CEEA4B|nr:polysaccharide biosynthesis C-terminal domain-containing protein [Natronobeatus ordinarius]